jgi:Cof subfamily protein (haloacid dehalogenase superfamily)
MGVVCYNDDMNLPNALFFDIDGTLLDTTTHQIPESAINALNTLNDQGYSICIATGRNIKMFRTLKLEGLVKWKYLILNNGHVIMDGDYKVLRQHTHDPKIVRELIERCHRLDMPVFLSGPEGDMLSMKANVYVEIAHRYFKEPIPEVKNYDGEPIDQILIYEKEDFDWDLFSDIQGLEIRATTTTSADVLKAGVSKHHSILDLLESTGHSDYYIAFGDSMNDYDMLQHAPISVAMGNGVEAVKKIAHYVASPVDEDGIAKMLSQLGYLID